LLCRYLQDTYAKPLVLKLTPRSRVDKALLTATKNESPKLDYKRSKVSCARALCKLMSKGDLDVLDLKERLGALVQRIRKWNYMPVPTMADQEITA
jgi:hypothetical protein